MDVRALGVMPHKEKNVQRESDSVLHRNMGWEGDKGIMYFGLCLVLLRNGHAEP